VTHPTDLPPAFTPTSIPAVDQVSGVYVVLQGVTAGSGEGAVLMGGYQYLQWSDAGGCFHEAIDANSMGGGDADLGAAVVAPLDGIVTDVLWWNGSSQGFGNHLALYVDDARAAERCYLHAAHLNDMVVIPGQRVTAGERLGTCGRSGFQPYAHLHLALWHDLPPGGSWEFWQTGYSQAWVAEHTLDPQDWFWASVARANELGAAPPPQEVFVILTGAQQAAVQAALWGDHWRATDPGFALPTAWRDEWIAGRYRGRPVSEEQVIPASEDKPEGRFQAFELGVAAWLPGQPVSWNG